MVNRDLVLLGEAASAIAQCCHLLGEERTNRILTEIDEARQQLRENV